VNGTTAEFTTAIESGDVFAIRRNGTTVEVWRNGTSIGTGTVGSGALSAGGISRIGGNTTSAGFTEFDAAHLWASDQALSNQQIIDLSNWFTDN